ncbi:MAG: type IX secretion system membrane protein PorP/SprF [Crocinitomicaceae bacterium]
MNFKRIFTISIFIWAFSLIQAQDIIPVKYYYNNLNYYNPAAGLKDSATHHKVQVYGSYKFIKNPPVWKSYPVLMANYEGKFGNDHSLVNAYYVFDNYSFYSRHQISLGYGYNFTFKGKHQLRLGIRANLNLFSLRKEEISHIPTDNLQNMYIAPDFDFGIQYYWKGLFTGLSGKNLIGYKVKVEGEDFLGNQRGIYFNFGYDFTVKENYQLTPYTLVSIEKDFQFDLGFMAKFFKLVELGYQFGLLEMRNTYLLSGYIAKKVRIGASFDHSFIRSDMNLNFLVGVNF